MRCQSRSLARRATTRASPRVVGGSGMTEQTSNGRVFAVNNSGARASARTTTSVGATPAAASSTAFRKRRGRSPSSETMASTRPKRRGTATEDVDPLLPEMNSRGSFRNTHMECGPSSAQGLFAPLVAGLGSAGGAHRLSSTSVSRLICAGWCRMTGCAMVRSGAVCLASSVAGRGCSQCSLGSLLASVRRCALLAEPL
jgi:hypothetical protein